MHVRNLQYFLEKKRYEESMYFIIKGFDPGGDTSIPPVPVLRSILPLFGIST